LFFKRSGKIKKKGNSGKLEIGVLTKSSRKLEIGVLEKVLSQVTWLRGSVVHPLTQLFSAKQYKKNGIWRRKTFITLVLHFVIGDIR
jgi:hypothetical protein